MGKFGARPFLGEIDASGKAEDPSAWLDHFEIVSSYNRWNSDEKKLRYIPACLTEEAFVWYSVNRSWIHHPECTWKQFCNRFLERFRPANYFDVLEEELRTPMKKETESIRGYAERYQRLYLRLDDQASASIDQYRRFWIAGLPTSVKRRVRITNPTTFAETVYRCDSSTTHSAQV